MAQHLRIGSVVDVYTSSLGVPPSYDDCIVTNITDSYIEFEWLDPSTSTVRVLVRPWTASGIYQVVTD